jgi:mRNA deadenylase 3'-5' endonuclease subunit Ccr4
VIKPTIMLIFIADSLFTNINIYFILNNMINSSKHLSLRQWVPNIDIGNSDRHVRIMTYNILCDSLTSCSTEINEEDLHKFHYLNWDVRRKKILDELNELNADIICIQEFERDEEIINNLGGNGYDVYN